jgi:hypothetical protein
MATLNRRGFIRGMLGLAAMAAFPFTWTAQKAKQIYTGARCKLFINGVEMHYAQGVEFTIVDKHTNEELMVLGHFEPVELRMQMTRENIVKAGRILGDDNGTH